MTHFYGLTLFHSKNQYKGMGKSLRSNDFSDHFGGQALVLIGLVALNAIDQPNVPRNHCSKSLFPSSLEFLK